MAVLNSLADQIYVVGETSGKAADMVAAEEKAADEIRQYIGAGSTDGLLAKENGNQSRTNPPRRERRCKPALTCRKTVQELGAADLTSQLMRLQKKPAEPPQKQ